MATRLTQREFRGQRKVAKSTVVLDAELIEGFQKAYLHDGFDDAAGTALFHREMWADACDVALRNCAWAAPRGHSKSSSVTLTFVLAAIVLGAYDYVVIASDTEGQASGHLKEVKNQFFENEAIRNDFGVKHFLVDTGTEFELEFNSGRVVRVIAKGSEQRIRGIKWRNKRPDLIVGDDLENDEIVMNAERRKKFKQWFTKTLMPCGAKNCKIIVVGTILHHDSLLTNLIENGESWKTRMWAAHEAFDDFSNILWPERFSEDDLRKERQKYVELGESDGYSQEYLNRPIADGNSFFQKEDLLPIPIDRLFKWENEFDRNDLQLEVYVSVDLAISLRSHADKTVFTVATMDSEANLDIVDCFHGRMDSKQIIDTFFKVHELYAPELFLVESGAIQKSLGPFLNEEMARRQRFLSIQLMVPTSDKLSRARSIQARMRAGRVRFYKDASWYAGMENELLQFPRGRHDDQVDTLSQFGMALDDIIVPPTAEELEEEEWERDSREAMGDGRSAVTGY